jgi:hypothetical protein
LPASSRNSCSSSRGNDRPRVKLTPPAQTTDDGSLFRCETLPISPDRTEESNRAAEVEGHQRWTAHALGPLCGCKSCAPRRMRNTGGTITAPLPSIDSEHYLQHVLTLSQSIRSIGSRSSFHGTWVRRLHELFCQHLHLLKHPNHVSQRHSPPTSHLLPASAFPRRKTPIDAVGL